MAVFITAPTHWLVPIKTTSELFLRQHHPRKQTTGAEQMPPGAPWRSELYIALACHSVCRRSLHPIKTLTHKHLTCSQRESNLCHPLEYSESNVLTEQVWTASPHSCRAFWTLGSFQELEQAVIWLMVAGKMPSWAPPVLQCFVYKFHLCSR